MYYTIKELLDKEEVQRKNLLFHNKDIFKTEEKGRGNKKYELHLKEEIKATDTQLMLLQEEYFINLLELGRYREILYEEHRKIVERV